MPTAPAKAIAIVTKTELLELADWERKYADAKKKQAAAEKEVKFRRLKLAEIVLGVTLDDELKKLPPATVERRFAKRLEDGDWKPERGAPEFSFVKTNQGAYPAWRQCYVDELGETAAAQISAETPLTYSYAVEVTLR